MFSKVEKKCSKCSFFSGVQCHGHGDFWGSCNLFKLVFNLDGFVGNYTYESICYPESICKLQKFNLVSYYKEIKNENVK